MNPDQLVQDFAELFRGRQDAYGTEQGGCDRVDAEFIARTGRTHEDVYLDQIDVHLGEYLTTIGVYPLMDDGEVNWGCVDFDEGEQASAIHAINLVATLGELSVTAHMERSRSKGFHVWVFMAAPVGAEIMRTALMAACQIAEAPTREVNPKQTKLTPGQVGNYVRLPYPGELGSDPPDNDRRVMLDWNTLQPIGLRGWVRYAMDRRTWPSRLGEVAALYVPPEPPAVSVVSSFDPDEDLDAAVADSVERLTGMGRYIWEHGPREGQDRSSSLWKFAALLAETDMHTPDEAMALVRAYDERWGQKFAVRGDGEQRLEDVVVKAFQERGRTQW